VSTRVLTSSLNSATCAMVGISKSCAEAIAIIRPATLSSISSTDVPDLVVCWQLAFVMENKFLMRCFSSQLMNAKLLFVLLYPSK
jgi:hypothetical protein